jgi:hypothetical protein
VDVSSIPGFKGVPDAPRVLADYFRAAAERAAHGEPPSAAPPSLEAASRAAPARPLDDDPAALRRLAKRASALDLVLRALSEESSATPEELAQLRRLLDRMT